MKFKLIILLLSLTTLCYSQESSQVDSVQKSVSPAKNAPVKKVKKRKKFLKVYIEKEDSATDIKKADKNLPPFLLTIIFVGAFIVAIFIIKKIFSRKPSGKPYNYFKNEYIKSLGWNRNNSNEKKRDELIAQLDSLSDRQAFYRYQYLQSDEWNRKRYVVLKRDNWKCVYCGMTANQVHHKRYAKNNIGSEPIDWLVSVCKKCHDHLHD